MTKIQAQIIELFQTLAVSEQKELAAQLFEAAAAGSFFDHMTPQQRAELEASISQADRGEGVPADKFFSAMAQKYGFSRPS